MMDREMERLMKMAREFVEAAEANAAANPTTDSIQVVVVEPLKKPYKKVIPNTLEAMQEIVGGHIENVFMGNLSRGAKLGIVLNEEGKIFNLPFNRRIVNYDILVGNFFITAYNFQGDNVSLTDEEADKIIRRFSPIEIYI